MSTDRRAFRGRATHLASSPFPSLRPRGSPACYRPDDATSFSDIAKALGWYNSKNELNRSKAQRTIGRLKQAKLVEVECGRHILTEKGKIWSSVCTCFQTDDDIGEINNAKNGLR